MKEVNENKVFSTLPDASRQKSLYFLLQSKARVRALGLKRDSNDRLLLTCFSSSLEISASSDAWLISYLDLLGNKRLIERPKNTFKFYAQPRKSDESQKDLVIKLNHQNAEAILDEVLQSAKHETVASSKSRYSILNNTKAVQFVPAFPGLALALFSVNTILSFAVGAYLLLLLLSISSYTLLKFRDAAIYTGLLGSMILLTQTLVFEEKFLSQLHVVCDVGIFLAVLALSRNIASWLNWSLIGWGFAIVAIHSANASANMIYTFSMLVMLALAVLFSHRYVLEKLVSFGLILALVPVFAFGFELDLHRTILAIAVAIPSIFFALFYGSQSFVYRLAWLFAVFALVVNM